MCYSYSLPFSSPTGENFLIKNSQTNSSGGRLLRPHNDFFQWETTNGTQKGGNTSVIKSSFSGQKYRLSDTFFNLVFLPSPYFWTHPKGRRGGRGGGGSLGTAPPAVLPKVGDTIWFRFNQFALRLYQQRMMPVLLRRVKELKGSAPQPLLSPSPPLVRPQTCAL